MADVLEGDRYAVATSLTNITLQLAQVVGFLAAGALVAALDPSAALLIDGVTFAVSALWLAPRPAAASRADRRGRRGAAVAVAGHRRRPAADPRARRGCWRSSACCGWRRCSPPPPRAWPRRWSRSSAARPTAIGILLAAHPLGVTIGGLVIARLVPPDRREGLVVPLVVLSLAPLLAGRAGRRPGRPGRADVRPRGGPAVRVRARRLVADPAQRLVRAGGARRLPRARLRRRGERPLRRPGASARSPPGWAPRGVSPAAWSRCPAGSA